MPYSLENLVIDRVDLVDEGANSAAFISLYKRKEQETMTYAEIIAKMNPDQGAIIQAELDRLGGDVTKNVEALTVATAAVAKAEEDLKTANDSLAGAKEELDTLKSSLCECGAKLSEDGTCPVCTKAAGGASFDEEETMKAMPEAARAIFAKMKAQKDAAEESLRKSKEAEVEATATAKAASLTALPIEQTKLVGILKACSPEVLELLTAVNTAFEGTVLGEVGKNVKKSSGASTDAWGKIEAKADEIAKDSKVTKAKAITMAVEQNPDLYKEYLQGGAN